MLAAHSKREAIRMATEVKNAMISGLWANPNFDDDKQTRRRAIDEINESLQELVRELYDKIGMKKKDAMEEHPFFAAIKLADVPEDTPIHRPHDQIDTTEIDQM